MLFIQFLINIYRGFHKYGQTLFRDNFITEVFFYKNIHIIYIFNVLYLLYICIYTPI